MAVQFSSIKSYQTSGSSGVSVSDNFDARNTGDLAGQGTWINVINSSLLPVAGTSDKYLSSTDRSLAEVAIRLSDNFSANHSAQATLKSIEGTIRLIGVIARASGTTTRNYYVYYVGGGGGYLSVVVNSTEITIASSSYAYATGDVIKLVVSGTSIKCYLNGSLDSNLGSATSPATGSGGDYVDNRVSTGTPGVFTWTADSAYASQLDNFVATDV